MRNTIVQVILGEKWLKNTSQPSAACCYFSTCLQNEIEME
jgi:hypothetical protein